MSVAVNGILSVKPSTGLTGDGMSEASTQG